MASNQSETPSNHLQTIDRFYESIKKDLPENFSRKEFVEDFLSKDPIMIPEEIPDSTSIFTTLIKRCFGITDNIKGKTEKKLFFYFIYEIILQNKWFSNKYPKFGLTTIKTYKKTSDDLDDDFKLKFDYLLKLENKFKRLHFQKTHPKIDALLKEKNILGRCDRVKIEKFTLNSSKFWKDFSRSDSDDPKEILRPTKIKKSNQARLLLHQSWIIAKLNDLLENELWRPPERGGSEYEKALKEFECLARD